MSVGHERFGEETIHVGLTKLERLIESLRLDGCMKQDGS